MGVLHEKVMMSQESKKQGFIQELHTLGITEFQGQSLDELDYYTLRHALSIARIRIDSDANKWY